MHSCQRWCFNIRSDVIGEKFDVWCFCFQIWCWVANHWESINHWLQKVQSILVSICQQIVLFFIRVGSSIRAIKRQVVRQCPVVLFGGAWWCPAVLFGGAQRCLVVLFGGVFVRWCPGGARQCSAVPGVVVVRWCSLVLGGARWCPVVSSINNINFVEVFLRCQLPGGVPQIM